jgi:hypothetical protein
MNQNPEDIKEKLDKILNILSAKESPKIKILEVLEKLLIPILLGVLTFVTSEAGFRISQSQLKLAESQEQRQKDEAKNNLQIKYIELFYNDITSGDNKKRSNAVQLAKKLISDEANPLLSWASTIQDIKEDPKLVSDINAAKIEVDRRDDFRNRLKDYKIVIYFPQNDQKLWDSAQEIKQKLVGNGLSQSQVNLESRNDDFFKNLGYPNDYEIRYDKGLENDEAEILENFLTKSLPSKKFVKRDIGSGTKNSISIFFIN